MTEAAPTSHECLKLTDLLGHVSDRWTLRILLTLDRRSMRFNELKRSVEGVSQQMLSRSLKNLERDGMIVRTVHPTVPPQVEYGLTELGASLAEEGRRLGHWASSHIAAVDASRQDYDGGR